MENLLGKVFGRLTVIEHVGFTKNRNAIWKCKCICGNEKNVVAGNLKSGTQSCGCYFREQAGSYHKLADGEAAFNDLYSRYKDKAISRGYIFELTKEQFRELSQQVCYYCGTKPHKEHKVNKRVGRYFYNGIDRIDNAIGYTYKNSRSSCYICNRMKHAMGEPEFLTHIERIYKWQTNIV